MPSLSLSISQNSPMNNTEGSRAPARPPHLAFLLRVVVRISRARWFGFLRRVFQYQNGSRSDLGSNPFNSNLWLLLELVAILAQMIGVTLTMAVSSKERPLWAIRIWIASYNVGNFMSLPLLYWRWLHSRGHGFSSSDLEQQRITGESRYRLITTLLKSLSYAMYIK